MGKITKTMQTKHLESLSPFIKAFRDASCAISLSLLPKHLETFPTRWPFSRGDLYHWIPLLNRFDEILEKFCKTYKLDEGPQTQDFVCTILTSGVGGSGETVPSDLQALGYFPDGDRQLVESVLDFSRMLLENCGNRSIYASSSHLNNLLNTTSLSLLESTLLLGSQLAQRYQAALKRMNMPPIRHVSNALLANHYNINLERVQQLSMPFSKTIAAAAEPLQPTTPVTPSVKGKEKAYFNTPTTLQKAATTTIYASDLVSMVKGGVGVSGSPRVKNGVAPSSSALEGSWEEWGDVKITYYPKSPPESDTNISTPRALAATPSAAPTTPTPVRRSSNLGPHGSRINRQTSSEDSPAILPRSFTFPSDDTPRPNFKIIEISSSRLKSSDIHTLLRENVTGLPTDLQYELLTKLRVATALTGSLETRRQILAVRLLAITNLAYVHPEPTFQEIVLKQDAEEPRRLQLAFQLADLVHPPSEGDSPIPKYLQILAFCTLDGLTGHTSKFQDVCSALSTNVNHGVLMYVVRKAIAEMNADDVGDKITEDDEWRDSLFSLLTNISVGRTGGDMVAAGLIPILVEVLGLRTVIAERYYPVVLTFLDTIMYQVRDAFQTLVSAEGLDAVSNLIVYEVKSAIENASCGKGMRADFRSPSVDYQIPYFQQQTLKWLFKFIHHLMSTAGGYGTNFDRLLRNLIDSSVLLSSLREIISNGTVFGSIVWTNAVSILNDFINNEPTSFAVIAEAGLSQGLLEAVTGGPIVLSEEESKSKEDTEDTSRSTADESSPSSPSSPSDDEEDEDYNANTTPRLSSAMPLPRDGPLARGIMPSQDTINIIPQAFGALCLNSAGMKMFRASKALESFFEIFESPEHVKCMDSNRDLPANLGSSFDELVRHHPPLKAAIMTAVLNMVARVDALCSSKALNNKIGAKLWTVDSTGKTVVADQQLIVLPKGKGKGIDDGSDVEMQDADPVAQGTSNEFTPNASMTPYLAAVATFLSAIFSNATVRSEFCMKGGIEHVLNLAESPCLSYDFSDSAAASMLQQVVALLAEAKPHLVMPSLLKRAHAASEILQEFTDHKGETSFFAPFVNAENRKAADMDLLAKGTRYTQALVRVHSLVGAIQSSFQPTGYHHRNTNTTFTQINVSDYYVQLIHSLGPLLGSSIREEMVLQGAVPDYWKNAPRVKDAGFGEPVADTIQGVEAPTPVIEEPTQERTLTASLTNYSDSINDDINEEEVALAPTAPTSTPDKKPKSLTKQEQSTPYFKNFQVVRYLLTKMSRTISPLFQTVGKALMTKRNPDSFQKQGHVAIADALAEAVLSQLTPPANETVEGFSYNIALLHVLNDMLIELARSERPIQTITLVLLSFKEKGGLNILNHMLEAFTSAICVTEKTKELNIKYELATVGTKNILTLYGQIVHGRNVTEAAQTASMITRTEKGFSPAQFLVDLRMAVLPIVRRLWESELIEKGSSHISEKLIEIIRNVATADFETGAAKRSDKPVSSVKTSHRTFRINHDLLATLGEQGYELEVASEALYRCNNNVTLALDYCREMREDVNPARHNPIPAQDVPPTFMVSTSSRPRTTASTGTATPDDHAVTEDEVLGMVADFNSSVPSAVMERDGESPNFDQFLNTLLPGIDGSNAEVSQPSAVLPVVNGDNKVEVKQVTIDDLNEGRDAIRDNLIDKCLDVINAHGEVTFEVADLITTVVNKSTDSSSQRKTVGETLVIALMSFAGEEDVRPSGKKIAAYAHLLALMLRDKQFYSAAVGELKENLSTLLSFVKLSSDHSTEEPSPWISHILLIVEMLLSEDARPQKTKWNLPRDENDTVESPVLEDAEMSVSPEERSQLLDAILEILPRIGKDESLALAVLRILVILTRTRSIAQAMGEKKNIQRLFVMAKQLAGASTVRIQSPLLLILRHIIEDDETIKQIMRAEIKAYFETNRQQRNIDEKGFLRGLAHTSLRNPQLFIEVTNEMVKFNRWTFTAPETPSRHHSLVLKDNSLLEAAKPSDDAVQPTVQATEDLTIQDLKPSTEAGDSEMIDVAKPAIPELKAPIVENPDGVIHFLLCELLNYRDVEDKDTAVIVPPPAEINGTPSNGDVDMSGTSSAVESTATNHAKKPAVKPEFKSEEHPIYIYRCFILQCLTELLTSYNRTKVEFINFKRSAPPLAMTPSKPRSSVVNYLLFDLIPIGTLDHVDTTAMRKKLVTSTWADSVLTALLAKTGEHPIDKTSEPYESKNESDLLFVREFVLQNILKAYKEASLSIEPLDVKYARMLALADLMNHIMTGKDNIGMSDTQVASVSQKQLRRIMFDKGYITALTSSIADIDLNFPGAKRAVKYILRPLKTLTTTAIALSDMSLISATPGQGEEDDIESATSLSEPEDDREETPDLFRNSTLGMFEPGREEDSESDSDDEDEEMYEGEYDDEMEYDEEEPGDDEDNISEEDEEIEGMEGMGPIEGLSGDHGVEVEVIMGDDDDDDDEDSEDDDEDDEDDHDSEDDDARVEIIDEAGNVQQMGENDMGEWESDEDDDGDEEDYEGQAADQEEEEQIRAMEGMGGPLGQIVRALGNDQEAIDLLGRLEAEEGLDPDDEADEHVQYDDDGGEDDDEDEDEDLEDEELLMEQHLNGPRGISFGWGDEVDPPMVVHRRPRHGGFSPFPSLIPGGGHRDPSGDYHAYYRSHRPGAPVPRSADEGINPLLQRSGPGQASRDPTHRGPAGISHGFLQAMEMAGGGPGDVLNLSLGGGRPHGESPTIQMLEDMIRHLPLPGHLAGHRHALQFHITTGPGQLPPDLQALFGGRTSRPDNRHGGPEPSSATSFTPLSTSARWLDDAKILYGVSLVERAADLTNAILSLLVPPAIEADKAVKAAEAERARKVEVERKEKAEKERLKKEAKEAEEIAAKEKKEAEERAAAEQAAAEARTARGEDEEDQEEEGDPMREAMDGVETEAPAATEETEEAPAADRPRITTMIRGSPYDITDLDIDPSFLNELPEEIREEVIMNSVAERRQRTVATGAQPSDIDQEFLDALPDDIRDEIIQQERQDRRRREREERSRQSAAAGVPGGDDMNPADMLAAMDPALRNQILMEQDEATLALLPREITEEARAALRGQAGMHPRPPRHVIDQFGRARRPDLPGGAPANDIQRAQRRATVQMLDKPGIATLLRLMFILQHGSLRGTLNSVLQNVSMNRHNRNEVLSTLLLILQDGSVDMPAVERSFAHLSLRAKQPKDAQPKTPQPLKRAPIGLGVFTQTNMETSPLMVVQQCLTTLVYLNSVNPHVPAFFLTEHEIPSGLKRNLSRKGKGKENKAAKFALNSLLSLLDRDLIIESASVMESLSNLLNMITSPLQALQRKPKEIEQVPKINAPASVTDIIASAPTTSEQATEQTTDIIITDAPAVDIIAEQPTVAADRSTPNDEQKTEVAKEPEKKPRQINPPIIPEHNLKLVINIFVARECSAKTFRDTLSTIKNLSAIPGTKAVFGRELISKAQGLGEVILVDLDDLLPQIVKATNGTEIQGVALAKFSPGQSDQNKLLRVLTALDHLFDPKREKKDKIDEAEKEGESFQLVERQDILSSLYNHPTFGRMWERLSACLGAIREREHMLNVATILLPLIEALMVVCKNTTLRDTSIAGSQKQMLLTSPPPESRMESLFFTFTEEHRKILNDLVRHTPKLMSGTFSLLVKNPKVLEFDNKRNYFSRSIHSKPPNNRQAFAPLQLSVRRDQVFHDSFKSLYFKSGDEMKYGKLSIRFHGEEGVDAGGVTREWFQVLSRQMFDPGYALFIPVSSDRTTFHPNQLSSINEEHLMFFKFIGRIIGKALYEGRVLDCHFSRAVYKRILGKAVSVKDMESLDPDYYKSLIWMLENDITDIITETFSVDNDKFGVVETIDFIPNGRMISVTEENKHEYVRLMVEWRLTGSVKGQLDEFLKGFHDIIPADLVAIFNEQELELLISGLPEIDVDDWKSNTEYHNYSASSPQIQWFWRAVRSYDKEERAKLLQFVTGTSKVPLNGFRELEGMNGFSRFNIHRDYGNKDRLPSSHTCFNQIDLPEYESYEALRAQVLTAITAGSEYFGFA